MNDFNFTLDVYDDRKNSSQTNTIPASAIILEKTERITARELENTNHPVRHKEDEKKKEETHK